MDFCDFVIKYFLKYAEPRFRYKTFFKIYGTPISLQNIFQNKIEFFSVFDTKFSKNQRKNGKNVKFSCSRLRRVRFSILSPTLVHENTYHWRYPPTFETHWTGSTISRLTVRIRSIPLRIEFIVITCSLFRMPSPPETTVDASCLFIARHVPTSSQTSTCPSSREVLITLLRQRHLVLTVRVDVCRGVPRKFYARYKI